MVHNHYPEHLTATVLHRATSAEIAERLASLTKPFTLRAETERGLLIARDHLGVEQSVYGTSNRGWVTAPDVGEIHDLLRSSDSGFDEAAIVAHIGGLAPRPDTTFFRGIHSVKPGTIVRLNSEGAKETTYWNPADFYPDASRGLDDAAEELGDLLIGVLGDHARGAPVAATLSSGMDSTAVLAALVEAGADVVAVTWAFPDVQGTNASQWARKVADRLEVALIEIPIRVESLLPESGIVTRRSTPLFNVFDHLWRVACGKVASQGRHTLFTGLSGDYLFGGWVPAAADLLLSMRLRRLSDHLRLSSQSYPSLASAFVGEALAPLGRQLLPSVSARKRGPVPWLRESRYDLWLERQRELIGPGTFPGRAERISKLTDGTIPQVTADLAAQARPHDVKLHHPFLDRRLVEFALSLPSWLLDDGATTKLVLRRAMRDALPEGVEDYDDVSPEAVAQEAMRARETQLMDLTRDMRAADMGYVSEPILADRVARFMAREHDDMSFWNTLTLEDWLRRWW